MTDTNIWFVWGDKRERERENVPLIHLPCPLCTHALGMVAFIFALLCLECKWNMFSSFQTLLQPRSLSHSYHLTAELAVWNPCLFHCCGLDYGPHLSNEKLNRALNITYKTKGVLATYLFRHTVTVCCFVRCGPVWGWASKQMSEVVVDGIPFK